MGFRAISVSIVTKFPAVPKTFQFLTVVVTDLAMRSPLVPPETFRVLKVLPPVMLKSPVELATV